MVYSRSVLKAVIAVGAASSVLSVPLPPTGTSDSSAVTATFSVPSASGTAAPTSEGTSGAPPVPLGVPAPGVPVTGANGAKTLSAREFNIIVEDEEEPHSHHRHHEHSVEKHIHHHHHHHHHHHGEEEFEVEVKEHRGHRHPN
ncbi:hypothetical protein GGU11DRAFT_782579, partial [Lentinula aff. detonsa]